MNIQEMGSIVNEFKEFKSKEEQIGAMAMTIYYLRKEVEAARLEGMRSTLEAVMNHRKELQKHNEQLAKIIGNSNNGCHFIV